jgi:hypothetical protein
VNVNRRLNKLLDAAKGVCRTRRREARRVMCKGMPWNDLLEAVVAAVAQEDCDVLERIMGFVEERAATPYVENRLTGEPKKDEHGNIVYEIHHFIYWLWGLQEGSWSLPERLPRAVLEGFADRHGCVLWRCEDCFLGLANGRGYYDHCPVCGSDNISMKDLSRSKHWEHYPVPKVRGRSRQQPH